MSGSDHWIEARYWWLCEEHQRQRGGVIGTHYLKCISAQYARFLFHRPAARSIPDMGRDRDTFTMALPAAEQQFESGARNGLCGKPTQ